ncbi:three-helix bundle dimerization domain-containing protein [Streptomyces sp. NPDC046727]|uniref:three-helix bundle dimerization domain-containing protein n=1 Tax=Streptomyces sp. NPDC046727 TaxID=3155373 RepID=UPI0033EF7FF7
MPNSAVERLKTACGETHSPDEITAVVAGAYATFRNRPVRGFIPILVERGARRILDGASHEVAVYSTPNRRRTISAIRAGVQHWSAQP